MSKKREIHIRPPGRSLPTKASFLDKGAALLQRHSPMKGFHIYVVGFHCAKHESSQQMEAHHYCRMVNRDFLQCAIFDGNTEAANLIGIEYIISEPLFDKLPEEEKAYWHPHNYEILSGQLVAPGLPDAAEKKVMKMLLNSYGKTWHCWHTGRYDKGPGTGDALPLGEANLMWSFNRDGEADEPMRRHRNEHMEIDEEENRRERQHLVEAAHPQCGVDTLKGAFPGAELTPPPGVQESGACAEVSAEAGGQQSP